MRKGHPFLARLVTSALSVSLTFSLAAPTVFANEAEETSVISEQSEIVESGNGQEETGDVVSEDVESEETDIMGTEDSEEITEDDSISTQDIIDDLFDDLDDDNDDDDDDYDDEDDDDDDDAAEAEALIEMTSVSVGGTTYYYADTSKGDDNTVYDAKIVIGRGPSAGTYVEPYTVDQLTQAGDSSIYYVVPSGYGYTPLTGTLYGYGEGTASTYKEVYAALGVETSDEYDAITSATNYTSFHAKDIPGLVTFTTDEDGNKAITGLELSREAKSVDAKAYVDASILQAAGVELSDAQAAALDITLSASPMLAPSENNITPVLASATHVADANSRYGQDEFDIVPDDSVEGYTWNSYWSGLYAATISDGSTTVGAVHWIDLYGESATSGAHYNKVQISLNDVASIAANAAEVTRYEDFYDSHTGNLKAGTYTITLYSEGYDPLTAEITVAAEAMQSTSIGGVTYYYADTTDDADDTVYQVSVTQGRGPSATTTVYSYKKSNLTQVGESNYYYIEAPGATELTGTLYGYGAGTASSYKEVYAALGAETSDEYDVISSATHYTSFHAKDIPSLVTYGTDADGNKAITGLNLSRAAKTVDATDYVEASVLKAAGAELSDEQAATLDITLSATPMAAPAENEIIPVLSSASYVTGSSSRYGLDEFDIVPDDSVEGYTWNSYWSGLYAATISDGTTTVGAVHWIDMYGESATSGAHYNKVQISLNNGTSVASNAANVTRYAAFYEENELKAGNYTVTLYSEGYEPLTAAIAVDGIRLEDKTVSYTGEAVSIDDALLVNVTGQPTYTYYEDADCTKAMTSAPVDAGTYYVRATIAAEDDDAETYESNTAKLVINKAVPTIKLAAKTVTYNGKAVASNKAVVSGTPVKTVTYAYYTDSSCKKSVAASAVKNAGTYYVKATIAADANHTSASVVARITIKKAAQTLKVKVASKSLKASKLKKKAVSFSIGASKAQGKVTYKSNSKKVKVTSKGKVTVKKGTKKGTYKITVKAAGNANYAAGSKTVTIKVK